MNLEAGPANRDDLPGRSYSYDRDQVVAHLGSDPVRGLDAPGVELMRGRFGPNRLPEAKNRSRILLFLEQFNNPLIYILFAAAVLTYYVSDPAEAITIFVV